MQNADCVTETRLGNSILVVYGFYKPTTTVTAAEKMMRVLRSEIAEARTGQQH
ncbi:MAG: chorismate synthase [Firmicutes bacterium]|nr:chorismate synthase [Bacillota bacterium]